MAHNLTMTELRRLNRYSTSDFALLHRLHEDFGIRGGRVRLAPILGISSAMAARILSGDGRPNLHRLAFHYGFIPLEEPTGWRIMPMVEEPYNAGPPMKWDNRKLEFLRQVFSNPFQRPEIRTLAWRMDTTERRLRAVLNKNGIDYKI